MNSPIIQILVLAAIAIFLILRLRNVLGTREGFEQAPQERETEVEAPIMEAEVLDPEAEIADFVPPGSPMALILGEMKKAEPSFNLREFLGGARHAYEMILMAYEKGDLSEVRGFLSPEVAQAFEAGIASRAERGLTVEASFIGVRDVSLKDASFNATTREGELVVSFMGELTRVTRNAQGEVIDGADGMPKRERGVWTFARTMGASDPNWTLVATGG